MFIEKNYHVHPRHIISHGGRSIGNGRYSRHTIFIRLPGRLTLEFHFGVKKCQIAPYCLVQPIWRLP